MKKILFILLLITNINLKSSDGDKFISGIIIDKYTQEELAGVLIKYNDGYTYTDFDGRFFLPYSDTLFIRMISYKDDTIIVKESKILIKLENIN
jgi:hypothetical protein